MTDEQIFDLAESYADWDDFGRWTFRDSDKLVAFVVAAQEKLDQQFREDWKHACEFAQAIQWSEREMCARMVEPLDQSLANEIRARCDIRIADMKENT